jgi:AAHS family 4-hydroxybenzoate transporter-like MFS transporter
MQTTFDDAVSRASLTRFQIVTALLCLVILMCEGVDMQLLGLVAPLAMADLAVDKALFGVAMSAALVGMALGAWLGGFIGDRIGRRWSLALAALWFGLATIVASTAGGIWSLAAWRVLGGLGFGSAYANALAMAGEWLPSRWRAIAITTLSVGTPAGGAVAGALAPHLLVEHGWRGLFVIFGTGTLGLVALVLWLLRDSPSFLLARGRKGEADSLAAKLLGHPVDLVAGDESPAARNGATRVGVLHRSNLRLNIGVAVSFSAATLVAYAILNWSTTFLGEKGIALAYASYAISLGGITSVVGSLAAGALIRMFGSRIVLLVDGICLAAVLIALALCLEGGGAEPTVLAIIALIGVSAALFSAAIASIYVVITLGYPQSCRSAGIGFGIFMGRVGAIAASAFGGMVLELGGASVVPFFAIIVIGAGLISAAALIIDRHAGGAARRSLADGDRLVRQA